MATATYSYDDVPYDHLAFAQTHPDRLATAARIFGLQPPTVSTCRVLELGCGSGGNLIPMAFHLPHATFVGIDLSRRQIESGQRILGDLGITNATLTYASILGVTKEWGTFDYIICHGVFSWVEPHVQDAILRIAHENLTAAGVAYISYNTYPGWHMREAVRHMMRYHTVQFEQPHEQIEQARALLEFLESAAHGSGAYGELLTSEVERLRQASDSYLYHEHLEQTNTPLYFHQFIDRAERAGLGYLAEASVTDMLTSHFPAAVAETLERISPDILHLEQYMDFVRNRLFRQTLLVHDRQRPKRALTPAIMHGLLVSSAALPDSLPVDLNGDSRVTFRNGSQRAEVSLPATKAAMSILMEVWPQAIDADRLCAVALERAAPYLETTEEEARRSTMGDLFGAVMYGMVNLHTESPNCTNERSDRPKAAALAGYQLRSSSQVVNAHHQVVHLDPLSAEVLRFATGERTVDAIVDMLLSRLAEGAITLEGDGSRPTRAMLARRLENVLAGLTRAAVLVR